MWGNGFWTSGGTSWVGVSSASRNSASTLSAYHSFNASDKLPASVGSTGYGMMVTIRVILLTFSQTKSRTLSSDPR